MLSSDGPNVNAAITNLVNKELTDSYIPMMFDIGSCNLHKVHNAFAKRLFSDCSGITGLQCIDAVGCAAGRASGL